MSRTYQLLILLIAILSFTTTLYPWASDTKKYDEEPIYCAYADTIIHDYCSYMLKQYNLYCIGSGGEFMDHVNRIQLYFNGEKKLSIEDSRNLIVACSAELLTRINAHADIRSHLVHYPFIDKDISLNISLKSPNHINNNHNVSLIIMNRGDVFYYFYNKNSNAYEEILRENYTQASTLANTKNQTDEHQHAWLTLAVQKIKNTISCWRNILSKKFS